MACNLTALSGLALECDNLGGLSALYAAPVADVTGVTLDVDNQVTGITMAAGKKFVGYSFRKGNASFSTAGSRDDKAGTSFQTTTIETQFNRMQKAARKELQNLFNTNVYVIAKDNNGEFHLIGYDSVIGGYAAATALNATSGKEMGEANSYALTLTAMTRELPYNVASAAITSII
jgi:hypothetical protein